MNEKTINKIILDNLKCEIMAHNIDEILTGIMHDAMQRFFDTRLFIELCPVKYPFSQSII